MAEYIFTPDVHSTAAAAAAFRRIFPASPPASILDVGCGNGVWMEAARLGGVGEVVGVDSSGVAAARQAASGETILRRELAQPFDLARRFDAVLCLEVAEHIPEPSAEMLIGSICRHGDLIYFSAACPGQFGQGHVNCQWPVYWQALFNRFGFSCSDEIRWSIWDDPEIQPWYRQNLFCARRDERRAGTEPRIAAAVHPDMLAFITGVSTAQALDDGFMPTAWYLGLPFRAVGRKLRRVAGRLRDAQD